MENTGRRVHIKRTQKDYSLAFKLQVVDEVERGHLSHKQAYSRKIMGYSIADSMDAESMIKAFEM